MYNNIVGGSLLSSDGYSLLRKKTGDHNHSSHEKDRVPKMADDVLTRSLSIRSSKAEFIMASVGEDGAYKILAQALNVEFSVADREAKYDSSASAQSSFSVPSPLDVANKVLGFVENRLNSELEAGADSERISNLISQAREGMQKGFTQARDDIESLGLMTKKLDKDIGKGFDRIERGLLEMDARFNDVQQREGLVGIPVQPGGVEVASTQVFQELVTDSSDAAEGAGVSSRTSYMNSSEFSLKTQDGDTITIRYGDAGAEVFKSVGNNLFFGQSQFQGYQLEVNGELDEDELAAIKDLFSQLDEVSTMFFGGRFQDAFASALEVGFDASEIASFSLDLSKVQTQEVRTYSNPGAVYEQGAIDLGSITKNQPLINMVELFEKSLELLNKFDRQQFDFREFVLESISIQAAEKDVSTKVSQNDFSDFTGKLFKLLAE